MSRARQMLDTTCRPTTDDNSKTDTCTWIGCRPDDTIVMVSDTSQRITDVNQYWTTGTTLVRQPDFQLSSQRATCDVSVIQQSCICYPSVMLLWDDRWTTLYPCIDAVNRVSRARQIRQISVVLKTYGHLISKGQGRQDDLI